MITVVESPIHLFLEGEYQELRTISQHFRYRPPNYFRTDSYQMYRASGGIKGWDGYHYPLLISKNGETGRILRGRKDALLAYCHRSSIPINYGNSKFLESPYVDLALDEVPEDIIATPFPLDTAQREAVVQWLKHGIGIAHHSVGAGKTACLGAAAARIKLDYPEARFLYYTPAERLVRQSFTEMCKFLPNWDITKYGGGSKDKDGKDMVVCTQAMLARHYRELLADGWFTTFYALLLDEVHHIGSDSARAILKACPAFFRLGASDSMREVDSVRHNAILGLCGPVRCTVTSGELIAKGRAAAPHIYLVDMLPWKDKFNGLNHDAVINSPAWTYSNGAWIKARYKGPVYVRDEDGNVVEKKQRRFEADIEHPDGGTYVTEYVPKTQPNVHTLEIDGVKKAVSASYTLLQRRFDEAIINFKERNDLIAEWVHYYAVDNGWPTLVVATRTSHIILLEALLKTALSPDRVRTLTGGNTIRQKDKVLLEWFQDTPGAVLIASVIREGVSISNIKAGVIADPIADWEVARQLLGRFIRKKQKDNTAHVTFFIDRQHRIYLKNALRMLDQLSKQDGFRFYHPVIGPRTIKDADVHEGGS